MTDTVHRPANTRNRRFAVRLLMGMTLLILAGCANRYPASIRTPVNSRAMVADVQSGNETASGKTVRWGGLIANVQNKDDATWVEVVQLPLSSAGRPARTDQSPGRFIAKINGFLDPQIYARGRELTVVGMLGGITDGKVGEQAYRFPVLEARGYYLWAKRDQYNDSARVLLPLSYWSPFYEYYFYPYPYAYYPFRHRHHGHGGIGGTSPPSSSGQARRSAPRPTPPRAPPVPQERK